MGGRLGTPIVVTLLCAHAAACGRSELYLAGEGVGSAGLFGSGAATGATGGSGGLGNGGRTGTAGGAGASSQGGSGFAGMGGTAGTGGGMTGQRPQPVGDCADPEDDTRFAKGTTRYVAMTPNCEGQAPCYATLSSAVADARHGDTILLLPGTYAGTELTQTGELGDLRITSRDGPAATFIEAPCLGIDGPIVKSGEIWVDRLTFRNCGDSPYGWAVHVASRGGVRVRVQDNVFKNSAAAGAIFFQTTEPEDHFYGVIARNRVLDHQGNSPAVAVNVSTTLTDGDPLCARIENNIIANNRMGITYGRAEVVNNTITGNTTGGSMLPAEGGIVANNIFFANDMPAFSDELAVGGEFVSNLVESGEFTGLNDNFTADPLFADAANGDYHLRDGSPAAAGGDEYYAPLHDVDGVDRRGFIRGIGAYGVDPVPAPAPDGLACGDGTLQYGPVATNYGTYVGFETCEPTRGLSCSSPCQWLPGPATGQISMLGRRLCVVRQEGTINCWNVAMPELVGRFWQVAVSASHVCALGEPDVEGQSSVRCWSDAGFTFERSGSFTQIVGDYSMTCGLRRGGFTCWDENNVVLDVDGEFFRVDVNRRICALSNEGNPTCFDGTAQKLPEPPAGPFTQMIPSSETVCGLRLSGELVCPPSKKGFSIAPRAGFMHVDNESYATVGLRPDGRVLEWETSWAKLPETDEPFVDVVASSDFGCGLTADRRVSCWKDDTTLPHE